MALGYEHVSEPLLVVEQFVYSAIALALAYVGYGITGVLLGYIIAMAISVGIGSTFLVKSSTSTVFCGKMSTYHAAK